MPAWLTIVLALGGSTIISSIVGFLIARVLRRAFEKKDEEREKEKKKIEKDRELAEEYRKEEEQKSTEQILEKFLLPIEKKLDNMNAVLVATSEGTLATLRNDILTVYYKCYDKGFRNDYDYQNAHDLYEAYKELHGNSFIKDIMTRFDALPTKESLEIKKKATATRKAKESSPRSRVLSSPISTVATAAAKTPEINKEEVKA